MVDIISLLHILLHYYEYYFSITNIIKVFTKKLLCHYEYYLAITEYYFAIISFRENRIRIREK